MSSKKERKQTLLLLLSKKQDYMTAGELASMLNASPKTIYRLIKKINDETFDGSLILSEKGRGYKLDYEIYMKHDRYSVGKKSNFSPKERRSRILEELLLSSPKAKNVYELFEEYYVGDSVIFNDEQLLAEELKKYDLTLQRKNRALAIVGDETAIRKAISDRIQMLNIIDIEDLRNNKELNFNNYDVLFVLDQLKSIEKKLDIVIPNPYNVNIFSHLYILISRSRKVDLSKKYELSNEEEIELERDFTLKAVAQASIQKIEAYLNKKLSKVEVYYLYQYLVSSRMQGSLSKATTFSPKVMKITHFYLDEMSAQLKILINNDTIFLELANHIKPMLNRLENGIRVKNSLLDQIKMTYEVIFKKITQVSDAVSKKYQLPAINEDENGFITLYFARIIETNQVPIRTLIMCTTGVGTSELLRVKVEKKFPELKIVEVVATRNVAESLKNHSDIELILTTIHLQNRIPIQSLLVSAMFTMDDQHRLQRKIEEIYHER
ncbi:DNA-binding/PRD domain-containing protein [Enterococcus sp. 7E2_DIV0204]|uniref:BglG family transcription antiterminator n=1 Tax=unclassified Enterococcus TaxID=2608891 RepID=UPI000A33C2F1|nr:MULTISPECIES: PRD domain-containing protein [unclassified Enterococcus]OTN86508.1 DNA-binding/PRD domain-containing protein [Enterococcus sp. 7E2_DIV0204]OTP47702.1 DNA-binding/PRD domain-containing protein [Enterococcus sp. 7D2_DIV0200]